MKLLAIDIGTSSVRAAILVGPNKSIGNASVAFETSRTGDRAEVDAKAIDLALIAAIKKLGREVKKVDLIAHTTMAPSWLAINKNGRAITPVVTHQDRRATEEAAWIEKTIGRKKHLKITGNRPFPGGISSTTWLWFNRNRASLMKRVSLVGHLGTWLIHSLAGERFTDPSNAGFMGVYQTTTLSGWCPEIYTAIGSYEDQLPAVVDSNVIAGGVLAGAAEKYGLKIGTPVLAGCMDGSAAMLAAGVEHGQLLNVCGSTDVLALAINKPKPHEKLLTRPLGVGKKWLAVSTLAAAGSAIEWAHRTLFSELSSRHFYQMLDRIDPRSMSEIVFDPQLAGSRTEMELLSGSISRLKLGTTRDEILISMCSGLSELSHKRLELLVEQYGKINSRVAVAGGVSESIARLLRRDWKALGNWKYRKIENATINGLWKLAEMAK